MRSSFKSDVKSEITAIINNLSEEDLRRVLTGVVDTIIHKMNAKGLIEDQSGCLDDILEDLDALDIDPTEIARKSHGDLRG